MPRYSPNVIDMFGAPDRPRDKPPPKPRRPRTEVLDPREPPKKDPETLDIFTANEE